MRKLQGLLATSVALGALLAGRPARADVNWLAVLNGVANGLAEENHRNLSGNGDYYGQVNQALAGAALVANDGTFLGYWTSQYDTNSLFNPYGPYGSKFQIGSIWDSFGNYGSQHSIYSPWNPYSTQPPIFVRDGQALCYLSVNTVLSPRLDPRVLYAFMQH